MADREIDKRESRPPTWFSPEDFRRERALSMKRSRSGHVSSLTEARREIEALWRDKTPPCVTLVREKFNRYEALWKNFVLQHDKLMEFVDVTEQGQSSEQLNILAQQRTNLAASVEEFVYNAATELNERVMQDLQELTKPSRRRSRVSRSRRSANSRSSSKTQALRLEAEKARLALVFLEEENQRNVEAETKTLELERKQRELLKRGEVEEEQLKGTFRLEALKTEADNKLAEVRKIAAIMELEAKIAEDMDSESSNNETTSMQLTAVDNALPSRSSTFNPPLTTVTTPPLSSTPKASASSAHTPAVSASSTVITLSLGPLAMSSLTSLTPPYPTISSEPSLPTPAFARVTQPRTSSPD